MCSGNTFQGKYFWGHILLHYLIPDKWHDNFIHFIRKDFIGKLGFQVFQDWFDIFLSKKIYILYLFPVKQRFHPSWCANLRSAFIVQMRSLWPIQCGKQLSDGLTMAWVQIGLLEFTIKSFMEHSANQQFPFVLRGNCTSLQHCTIFCINQCDFGFFC